MQWINDHNHRSYNYHTQQLQVLQLSHSKTCLTIITLKNMSYNNRTQQQVLQLSHSTTGLTIITLSNRSYNYHTHSTTGLIIITLNNRSYNYHTHQRVLRLSLSKTGLAIITLNQRSYNYHTQQQVLKLSHSKTGLKINSTLTFFSMWGCHITFSIATFLRYKGFRPPTIF